jgi:TolA-binding protein
LGNLGLTTDAARSYLAAFSGEPTGARAPSALFKLGASLGRIGQTQDACLTLAEVNVRFPGDPAVQDAQMEMQALGCQ